MIINHSSIEETINGAIISYTNKPVQYLDKKAGIGYGMIFSVGFFSLFFLGGAVYLLLAFTSDNQTATGEYLVASLFIVAGLTGILTIYNNKNRKRYLITLTFNPTKEILSYQQEGSRGNFEIGYGRFDHFLIEREAENLSSPGSSTKGREVTYYHVYLILKNDQKIWLYSNASQKVLKDTLFKLFEHVKLPVDDQAGVNIPTPDPKAYSNQAQTHNFQHSRFLQQDKDGNRTTFRFKRKNLTKKTVLLVLFFYFFLGVPMLLLSNLMTGPSLLVLKVIVGVLLLIFLLFGLYGLLLAFRDYELSILDGGIILAFISKVPAFNYWIEKTIEIPKEKLDQVYISRLKNGIFTITIQLNEELDAFFFSKILFGIGAFGKRGRASETSVNVWDTTMGEDGKTGPYVGDLFLLKQVIDAKYGLEDNN